MIFYYENEREHILFTFIFIIVSLVSKNLEFCTGYVKYQTNNTDFLPRFNKIDDKINDQAYFITSITIL